MKQKKFYEPLFKFISSGGEGLVITCGGRSYSFRTPTAYDYRSCLRYSTKVEDQELFLLATCLQTAGGFKVSSNHAYDLLKYFSFLPKIKRRIMPHFWKAVEEIQETSLYFEAFCYTASSRYLWSKWKTSSKLGAFIEGVGDHELTDIHLQWVSFNELEDEREKVEDAWNRSFFEASAMNPKGVEKVQKNWETNRKRQKERREKVIQLAEKGEVSKDSSVDALKSEEDLQKEYWSWVKGEEDDHDKIVREYKEKLAEYLKNGRQLISRQKEEVEEMAGALNSLSMNTPLKAFSDDEIEKLVSHQRRSTVKVDDSSDYDDLLSKKYLNSKQTIENKSSLMDQVSSRKLPTIGD